MTIFLEPLLIDADLVGKRCPRCRIEKPLTAFGRNRARADGLVDHCAECGTVYRLLKRPPKRLKRPELPNGMKWCTKCGIAKTLTSFGRAGGAGNGLQSWCRECHAAFHLARKPPKVEKAVSPPITDKKCTKCAMVKPLESFNDHGSKPGYLAPSCKTCQAEQCAKWRTSNPDKVKSGQESHYERNRERRIANVKAYTEGNPEKRAEIAIRHAYVRRAKIHQEPEVFDKTTIADLIIRDGLVCYLCNETTSLDLPKQHPKRTVRDHYIPIKLGGTHTAENLKIACWQCNNWKSARHPDVAIPLIAKRLKARDAKV